MNKNDLRERFSKIQTSKKNGVYAPHKPLLLLWAIGRCLRGEKRMVSYRDTEQALKKLLVEFAPDRKHLHPEYPFGRLRHDNLWEIYGTNGQISEGSSGDVLVSSLYKQNAYGGFPSEVYSKLRDNRHLAIEIAYSLIDNYFTEKLCNTIMRAVGIESELEEITIRRRPRNSNFSPMVLNAYNNRCAVCGFSVRLTGCLTGDLSLALEGAHIQWHSAQGPDHISNGLALCALHHELFDVGAFTISPDRKVIVATSVDGPGFDNSLGRFRCQKIFLPKIEDNYPAPTYLRWHYRYRFKSYRELYKTLMI